MNHRKLRHEPRPDLVAEGSGFYTIRYVPITGDIKPSGGHVEEFGGRAYWVTGVSAGIETPDQIKDRVIELAHKALEEDPNKIVDIKIERG
jgi:hypothetical protein